MHRMDTAERRRRLVTRHLLTPTRRTTDAVAVADAVLALHATDPATVYLSAWARMSGGTQSQIADAIYQDKSLIRLMAMRRTMFVVSADLAPVVQASSALAVAAAERRKLLTQLQKVGIADDVERWWTEVSASTLAALHRRGHAAAADLVQDEPRLNTIINPVITKSYETPQKITSRVLTILALEGLIVRGQPFGGWTATRNQWWPAEGWIPGGGLGNLDVQTARSELVRRWLQVFGPAPISDLLWWTGWTGGQMRAALTHVAADEVLLETDTALVLADDLAPTPDVAPTAVLLPALDPTPMGWLDRGWFLGEHRAPLFDRTGNIGPTIWWDGRVVGGWAQRSDGEICIRLLSDIGRAAAGEVQERAEDLQNWLGPLRVTPRFRTPLERELAG